MKQLISCRRTVFIGRVQLSNKTLFTNECKMQTRQKSESLLFQYHTARTNKRRLSSTYAVTSKTANMRQIMFVCVRSYCYLLPWFSENTWRSKVTLNPLHNLLSSWKQWKWVDQARRKRQRYRNFTGIQRYRNFGFESFSWLLGSSEILKFYALV